MGTAVTLTRMEPTAPIRPIIRLVVAYCDNRVIGLDGTMPWHLPADLAHFKRSTLGHPILMGRKTWASLQRRPLPGRRNLVLTRNAHFTEAGAEPFASMDEAIRACATATHLCVIGGEQVFRMALPLADEIFATEIHATPKGDTWFPALPEGQWHAIERLPQAAESGLSFDFVTYTRTHAPRQG
ncbi:MAG TPA: dihydrofolate reductase [Castellaniella sp.]|uniref:dihydrofolate reductase n=1 Tax=Castellaniella sp. TaxID=1955812 RepID=UPI002EDBF655